MSEDPRQLGYEPADVSGKRFAVVAGIIVVSLALILTVVYVYTWLRPDYPAARPYAELPPPHPALQAAPQRDLRELMARERLILDRVAWVDREAGIAQIPIETAMTIIAERGLPHWQPPQASTPARRAARARQEARP